MQSFIINNIPTVLVTKGISGRPGSAECNFERDEKLIDLEGFMPGEKAFPEAKKDTNRNPVEK